MKNIDQEKTSELAVICLKDRGCVWQGCVEYWGSGTMWGGMKIVTAADASGGEGFVRAWYGNDDDNVSPNLEMVLATIVKNVSIGVIDTCIVCIHSFRPLIVPS